MTVLQAALNGDRAHPAAPRTPESIAHDALAAVAAGAHAIHVHAFDASGTETLAADACAQLLRALRRRRIAVPVSLTTSAAIEPDPHRRLAAIRGWTDLPELVTANQGEPGIAALAEHLMTRGVGIEAGLLSAADAHLFVRWPARHRCVRVLIEPLDTDPHEAVRHAAEMERIVSEAGIATPQVHHGDGLASWAVNRRALERGHGIRTGLEDTPVLPDGRIAPDNRALVEAATLMIADVATRGAESVSRSCRDL